MKKLLLTTVAVTGAMLGTAGAAQAATAQFAAGCFWSVESNFQHVPGVSEAVSGYAGGSVENPTYEQVAYEGGTGHYETVQITYDPSVVSYEELLQVLWHTSDPTDGNGQFCDQGATYRPAVFALNDAQAQMARQSIAQFEDQTGYDFAVDVLGAAQFWPAEDYHQDYAEKNPERYQRYVMGCGRNQVIEELWGEMAFAGVNKDPIGI